MSDDQVNSKGRTILWLWLLAAVMALALLFGVMKWIEKRERLNRAKPVASNFSLDLNFQGSGSNLKWYIRELAKQK
jgi:hypothetical protein